MELKEVFRDKGLRLTPQRRAILEALQGQGFKTALELFQEVNRLHPGINFSTLYRNLELFIQAGLICRLKGPGGALYGWRRISKHHHHAVCKICGAAYPLSRCPLEGMGEELERLGFTVTEHCFEVYGLCENCRCRMEGTF